MAGTVLRRWNGNGGGRRWGPVSRVAGPVSSAKVFSPVSGYVESDSGNTQFCGAFVAPVLSGTETDPNGAQVHDAAASPGAIETDLENAQFDGAETELGGDVSEFVDVGQSAHYVAGQTCGFAGTSSRRGDGGRACAVQAQRARCAGVKMDGVGHRQGCHDVLDTTLGRAAGTARRAMRGLRGARGQRAEAGSLDSFHDAFLSCCTESPSSRVARVTSALHNLCPAHSSPVPAHNSHARMPHARCVVNSVGGHRRWETSFLCIWGNKVNEYEHSDWGTVSCCREACFSTAGTRKFA